jgi:hypothetical protein
MIGFQPGDSDLPNQYLETPALVPLDITEDMWETIARRLFGGAGPGGTDSLVLQQWLLHFGAAIQKLCKVLAHLTDWMANNLPCGLLIEP